MSDWTEGYVAELDYTYGYYVELNPLRIAMPFLNVGLAPPPIRTACELGFGQGISLNVHAAGTPIEWYGTDFNPSHAGFAQGLAAASNSGAKLFDQSFAEFCTRPDLPDFDFIALHGIWSWVSEENERVIIDFVRRKLRVGGVLYVSYNTQPGHSGMVPFRDLLMQYADMLGGAGRGIVGRIDASLAFAERLMPLNPAFALANPTMGERVKTIIGHNRSYLAHEYFNRDWRAMLFGDMVDRLSQAKVGFACSAYYHDHIDALNLTPDQQKFLAEMPDPLFRQAVRDFMINQQFRRDYWVKGPRRLPPLEQTEAVRRLTVMLVSGPRADITYTVGTLLGMRELNRRVYDAVIDALADYTPKTVGELEERLKPDGLQLGAIYEALLVLAGKADVAVVQDQATQEARRPHTDALNARVKERARADGELLFLASPMTGGGVMVPRFQQLFLLGREQGRTTPGDLASFAWEILQPQGQRLIKDGKPLEAADENLAELNTIAGDFIEKRLPFLEHLKVA